MSHIPFPEPGGPPVEAELMVTITVDEAGNKITLPFIQIAGIGNAIESIREMGHEQVVWHPAACGCCFVVHPRPPEGELMHAGYVVGPDGGATWHEHVEEEH
jgi:hypothetical protein